MSQKSLSAQIKEIRRELEVRRRVYPKWINSGRITQSTANHRIACLQSTLGYLQGQQKDLFSGSNE